MRVCNQCVSCTSASWGENRQLRQNTRSFFLAAKGCIWMRWVVPLGLQQAVFVALPYADDHSPETAVTGTRSCYRVCFRVEQLYSNCFMPKRAQMCVVLVVFRHCSDRCVDGHVLCM